MAKYEARQDGKSWFVTTPSNVNGIGMDDMGGRLTEAEARIIAFALNAIADGKELVAGHWTYTSEEGSYFSGEDYDGPTNLDVTA